MGGDERSLGRKGTAETRAAQYAIRPPVGIPTSVMIGRTSWRNMSVSGAHLALVSVNIPDFLPDLQELAPVHEGPATNVRLGGASRAARFRSWLPGQIQHRTGDAYWPPHLLR